MTTLQELHAKKKAKEHEIAETRGEAKAMTALGLAGSAGWAALEILAVTDVPKTKKELAFTAGIVAIGALAYAVYKHVQANKLEEDHKSWCTKVNISDGYTPNR